MVVTDTSLPLRRLGLVAVGLLVLIAGALAAVSAGGSVLASVGSQESAGAETETHSTEPIGSVQDAEEELVVSNATADPETVRPNESVTVTATLENPTDETVAGEIELTVDGTVEATLLETIPAGDRQSVSFELTVTETGSYNLSVAGTDAGTVDVNQDSRDEIPGFGIVAAVSALVALVGVRWYTAANRNG